MTILFLNVERKCHVIVRYTIHMYRYIYVNRYLWWFSEYAILESKIAMRARTKMRTLYINESLQLHNFSVQRYWNVRKGNRLLNAISQTIITNFQYRDAQS